MADSCLQFRAFALFTGLSCLLLRPLDFSQACQIKDKDLVRKACLKRGIRPESILTKLGADVEAARKANRAKGLRGTIRCGAVWRGQRKDEIPYRNDSVPFFVSKGKGQIGNALSPFNIKVPSKMIRSWVTEDGTAEGKVLPTDQPLELVWQAAKVAKGEDWPTYFARRARIYRKGKPQRRYLDRDTVPAGACLGLSKELVQYVPSRAFYCCAYQSAVSQVQEFKLLEDLVMEGFNLLLLGPDGHPVSEEADSMAKAYEDTSRPFGHERVLVAMLRKEFPWQTQSRCWLE